MHVIRLAKSYETFFWKEIDFIIWRADGRGRYGNHRKYWELDAVSSNFSSNSDAYMRPYGPMHQFLYSTWNSYHRGHPSYHLQKGSHQLEANICTETAPGGGGCPMTSMGMLATNPQTETGQRIYSAVCPTRLKSEFDL